ncbi:MAG: DUF2339 domain-containing protein [Actinomycetota bacterium]|nr:DUF2339 domain-containing protein [Actinomycetota bacterium]
MSSVTDDEDVARGHDLGMETPGPSLDRLAGELATLGERLASIGSELRMIQLDRIRQPEPAPEPAPPVPQPEPVPDPAAPVPQPAPQTRLGLLQRDGAGSRLLAWVGGSVTLLGVLLMLVLAVQRGWLGPQSRVLGGAVLGLALVGVALRVHRTAGGRAGGITLAATGVAALYLDVIAATAFYAYLPTAAGLATGVLVACGGLLLAHVWGAQPLAVAAVVGAAVFAPVLTGVDPVPLVGFLLVLQIVAAPVQLRHPWPGLTITAAVPPLLAGVLLDVVAVVDGLSLRIALSVPAVTVVALAVAVSGAARAHARGTVDHAALAVLAGSPVPVLLLAPSMPRAPGVAVVGVLAGVLLALWTGTRSGRAVLPGSFGALAGGLGALAAFEATALALDGPVFAATMLGEAIALAVASERVRRRGMLGVAAGFGVVGVLVALVDVVPPSAVVTFPAQPFLAAGEPDVSALVVAVGVGLLLAGLSLAVPWAVLRLGTVPGRGSRIALGILGGLGVLYAVAAATLAVVLLALPDRTGFLTGHVVVTVSWTVAALVLLAGGLTSVSLRTAGMSLVGAAVAKLVLFDLAALDGVARVAAFLGAGLVLLAAGTRYARLVAPVEPHA